MAFELNYYCPRWGSEDLAWVEFLSKVSLAGFDGVEWAIDRRVTQQDIEGVFNIAAQFGLRLIAQHYDTHEADFNVHLEYYQAWLEKVRLFPWARISSQTGKDHFTFAQNRRLIEVAGEQVIHETHRGKFSFAAHITREYLEKLPGLRLTLDLSHWCNVAESYLEDQGTAVGLAIEHADHIHARVGYPEGPQVADPRAPEWHKALDIHLNCWDRVVELKKNARLPLSFTTEFGPFPYMVHVPGTRQPIADQWEINTFMLDLLKNRYA